MRDYQRKIICLSVVCLMVWARESVLYVDSLESSVQVLDSVIGLVSYFFLWLGKLVLHSSSAREHFLEFVCSKSNKVQFGRSGRSKIN